MDNKPTFKHDFKTIFGIMDIAGANGYTKCLNSLYLYIEEVTKRNPDNRYIDAVELLERITNTNEEIIALMKEAENGLTQDLINLTS